MEIILKEDVHKLGHKGDVIKVADGYGRNYLLPQRKAIAATPANLRNIEHMRASAARKEARDRDAALALAGQLAQLKLVFQRRAGERDALFGSVTSMDVMHALAERGYELERRKIELPDPLKTLGEHQVPLNLFKGVKATLAVVIEREAAEAGAGTATPQTEG
ncbi:MAG: 50S ribosomal protein L9 [Terriglobales bacterium]